MQHRINKIKFNAGKDANDMLMRKLAINFLTHGKITTTEKKAKVLKSYLETIVQKMRDMNEANKNQLLSVFGSSIDFEVLKQVGQALKDKQSGYVKTKHLAVRYSDGAAMMEMIWAYPVVLEKEELVKKEPKTVSVKTTVDKKEKVKTKAAKK